MTAISTIVADESEANISSSVETFQWMQQWYPVAVVEFLDPHKPHSFQLLGKKVVLWRDGAQQWQCFDDACPHRLAPLSEGRVEADGTLLCAYHGWRFDTDGKCVKIPQSQTPELEAQHRANPKSCAIVYPTQEAQGLLWVWAESGAKGAVESKNRSPRIIAELEGKSDRVVKLFWNIRDMPYGWDYFMENVADPAHVPVSHHGLMGDRERDAKYYDMPRLREISTQEGFAFGVTQGDGSPVIDTKHDFQPPCLMKITTTFTDEGQLILVLYATPTRPGWCRHIGTQILVKNPQGKLPPGLGFFALPMPNKRGDHNRIGGGLEKIMDLAAKPYRHADEERQRYGKKPIASHEGARAPEGGTGIILRHVRHVSLVSLCERLELREIEVHVAVDVLHIFVIFERIEECEDLLGFAFTRARSRVRLHGETGARYAQADGSKMVAHGRKYRGYQYRN